SWPLLCCTTARQRCSRLQGKRAVFRVCCDAPAHEKGARKTYVYLKSLLEVVCGLAGRRRGGHAALDAAPDTGAGLVVLAAGAAGSGGAWPLAGIAAGGAPARQAGAGRPPRGAGGRSAGSAPDVGRSQADRGVLGFLAAGGRTAEAGAAGGSARQLALPARLAALGGALLGAGDYAGAHRPAVRGAGKSAEQQPRRAAVRFG